ncbi:PREDICTED: uncharacterized protein LOC105967610 [Erythranthe guttata]|uniref:uncharacterized protein LOC105957115 n=1 Tax=Erythranthe guttata TaxID=4155 RepID=UPI00064DFA1F|nr:PREDICTED: uncharacterized protein LOC105957115 [Erythranthe guttata]XP_012847674.1 PREDICTED: uncharacterized protein LOC105967610 [Erythranthe guttata]|eukprot:XP_012836494.1 PREDICTED: uncharacterized protein LOC105957115 [Erythranthe guttata]
MELLSSDHHSPECLSWKQMISKLVCKLKSLVWNGDSAIIRSVLDEITQKYSRPYKVVKRLAHRRVMYHSYSVQVHGYICSSTNDDSGSFALVHGYHGNSSLRIGFNKQIGYQL